MDRKALEKIFSMKIYAKTALKLFVAMPKPNGRLTTNFQVSILIFEVMANL